MSPLPYCRIFVCTCLCMDLYVEKLLAVYLIHMIPSASCSYSANSSKICSLLAICIKGISFMGGAVKWDSWLVCMLHCNNVFSFFFPTEEEPFFSLFNFVFLFFYRPWFPLFFFALVLSLFLSHVVSSLAYPNLLGIKRLGCCCC
jgi:hypothetical protein